MCRLFGFRSNVASRAHRSLISAENAVAQQANYHSDGWGIGYYLGDDAYLFRTSEGAATDEAFHRMGESLQSHTLLVHIRKATVGRVQPINSHPFRFGSWMFAHNGTLFGFEKLKDRLWEGILPEYQRVLFGTTDSEHLFFFLLSEMAKVGCSLEGRCEAPIPLLAEAQQKALSKVFQWAKELGLEAPKANYILTNGKNLFARRAGLELYLTTQKRFCPEAETCPEANKICLEGIMPKLRVGSKYRRCNHLLISSEPIGENNIWEEIPEGVLVALSTDFRLSVFEKPKPFWVTWPPEVTRHKPRKDVISAEH